ncbi:MAG: metal ABC transporter solute-binding protein, Zn/Mn family [Candidatus Nanopelagicales bacterium]
MTRAVRRWRNQVLAGILGLTLVAALAACGDSNTGSGTAQTSAPACPVSPIEVVVTTNVWGSVADQLAGTCANLNVVITSPTADPHGFEPTAATSAAFAGAKLVVMNGLGYDSWATKITESLGSSAPPVLDLGSAVGLKPGANPHIWYSPDYVERSAKAITEQLSNALPTAKEYFATQAVTFEQALAPYREEVAKIRAAHAGTKIGATETIFVYMADATGLQITTPPGFMRASADDSEPSASDVATFRQQLSNGTDSALIFNAQTAGGLPAQMRATAEQNNVPVVTVTETLTPEGDTFQAWQLRQLQALNSALG